jgi:pimeloyl-ACP methyl ester carboxylesterase
MRLFLRNTAILLGCGMLIVYAAVFALLVTYQRNLLFIGGRHEQALDRAYRAGTVGERDGTRLAVWRIAPSAPGAPLIVFFYGNAGTLSDFAEIGEELHRDGYGIVLASYRGYSGNPGAPSEAGLMDDARAILDALPKGHGPVVLWGQSLGTGIAARMTAEGRAGALILQSPYTSVMEVAAERFPIYPVRWFMQDRFDTLSLAPRIKVPVLIIHGTDDETVPYAMGVMLSRAFPNASFVSVLGGSHNLYDSQILPPAQKWLLNLPTRGRLR